MTTDLHEGPTPRDCPECSRLHDAEDDPWDLDPDLPFHPYVACPAGGCKLPANHEPHEHDRATINRLTTALRVNTHKPHDQAGEPNPETGFPVCSVCGAIQT